MLKLKLLILQSLLPRQHLLLGPLSPLPLVCLSFESNESISIQWMDTWGHPSTVGRQSSKGEGITSAVACDSTLKPSILDMMSVGLIFLIWAHNFLEGDEKYKQKCLQGLKTQKKIVCKHDMYNKNLFAFEKNKTDVCRGAYMYIPTRMILDLFPVNNFNFHAQMFRGE